MSTEATKPIVPEPSPELLAKIWPIIYQEYRESPEYGKIDILEWLIIYVKRNK